MADQFILLPRSGIRATTPDVRSMLRGLPRASSMRAPAEGVIASAQNAPVRVIDTVREEGAQLVEISPQVAREVNRAGSPLRAVPIAVFDQPYPLPYSIRNARFDAAEAAAAATSFTIECRDAATGAPISPSTVVAFSDFAGRKGAQGTTDPDGRVSLTIAAARIERLYVYSPDSYWGAFRKDVAIANGAVVPVEIVAIALDYRDAVRAYYGESRFDAETGVQVGIIDTGVGPHRDLNVVSLANTVTGQPAAAGEDVAGHGTHCAGLVGSNGTPPTGLRGVAPGVRLRGYRVFPDADNGATNYSILKALIFAAADGCDIVNLSLGGGPADEIVEEAIADARAQGMLVVIASGNDGRRPVSYPAAHKGATAVSAMGRIGTYPPGSLAEGDVLFPPAGTDPDEYVAGFSNVGPEIAATGLGVGVLSTFPNDSFAALSGTSMATPVVCGTVACLLSRDPDVFGMARNADRSAAIESLLKANCSPRGFGLTFEGAGLPDPDKV
jgi:subtilisin family serine protease